VLKPLARNDLAFLAHIAANPDWQGLARILRAELAVADEKLRVLPPTEVARMQGVSGWLVDFLATVEHAREQLAKTRDARPSAPLPGSEALRQ
jgi:hypothetical protein